MGFTQPSIQIVDAIPMRDVLLFGLAVYLAVIALVRLMLAQRGVVRRQVAREVEEERRRQAEAAKSEPDPQRQDAA